MSFPGIAREDATDLSTGLAPATGERAKRSERYWLSRFEPALPILELPADRTWPGTPGSREHETLMLDAGMARSLEALGAERGTDLCAVLYTGLATLVRRLSGNSDVVIGIAGSESESCDASAGRRAIVLPVRSDAAPGTAFVATLDAVAGLLGEARAHQDHDPEALQEKLEAANRSEARPLVGVMFGFGEAPDGDVSRLQDTDAHAHRQRSPHVCLHAVPDAGSLRLHCRYDAGLYDAETVRRWLDSLEMLLRCAVAQPDRAWDRLDWISARQMQSLRGLQPPRSGYDAGLLVQERFARHAVASPDRVALVFGAMELRYAELERRSNAIAHALRDRGIGRGTLVGVCLRREPDLYATVLGILKAGAAFVPLDPTYPKGRLDFMVADAGLRVVVSKTALLGAVDCARGDTLVLDEDLDATALARTGPLESGEHDATSDSTAYVIYTSGSTGRPKGVMVPHRALVNLLVSMQDRPGFSADDSLVAVTVMSFDMSIPELFLPLTVGGRVVVASRHDPRDGHELRKLLEASGATCMQATPLGWRLLLAAGWNGGGRFKALVGGESLPRDLAVALRERCGELWNMYGPTETTVWSTCAQLHAPERDVTIGRPIANTTVWVLDEHRQPCPIGVPGELWIGGDGVTLGYLNRAELTEERFVADPWSDRPGARMYRTGDRGRWRNDGTLEHLGRIDAQIKVHGYRIEPGEIEANLATFPGVSDCVVVARHNRPDDTRLVAYVVAAAGADPAPMEMRRHLKSLLPAYMIPQEMVRLDAIPLSPNGKVDRAALPAPGVPGLVEAVDLTLADGAARPDAHARTLASSPGVAIAATHPDATGSAVEGSMRAVAVNGVVASAVDPRQIWLAGIWRELLGFEANPSDNFFDIGGSSMLAMRMSERVAAETGYRIRLMQLAVQSMAETAAHLPVPLAPQARTGAGSKLLRNMRRLLGRQMGE